MYIIIFRFIQEKLCTQLVFFFIFNFIETADYTLDIFYIIYHIIKEKPNVTFLAEIYAAREKNDVGISSQDLADQVPGALVAPSFAELTNWLYRLARPGDLILTVGAGNIYTVGEALAKRGQEEKQ